MLIFRAGIHNVYVRIANGNDPDQKQSDLCLRCLSRSFWQANSVRNFRTLTVSIFPNTGKNRMNSE